jgi:hypothetical protein
MDTAIKKAYEKIRNMTMEEVNRIFREQRLNNAK